MSQVRVLFKLLTDVLTRMTSFSNGVSPKKVYLKPCQCFPKAEYSPFSVFPRLNQLSSKKPEKCNFLRHRADGASSLIVSMADLQRVPQECLGGGGLILWDPCAGEITLELSCSLLLQLALGIGCALSPSVSVTTDGADDIIVRQIMMVSVDLLLRKEWAEEEAGTLMS